MNSADFEELKTETETDLGRAIDAEEEHALKLLYYFGKGVKLKAQLNSEPERIGEVLPGVMDNIAARMEGQRRQGHRRGVMAAAGRSGNATVAGMKSQKRLTAARSAETISSRKLRWRSCKRKISLCL